MTKKVVIIPSNTDLNRGDQALVWESISLVQDIYGKKNVECILMTNMNGADSILQNIQTKRLGYHLIENILKHPGRNFSHKERDSKSYTKTTLIEWGFQAIVDFCQTRLLLCKNRLLRRIGELFLDKAGKECITAIKNADSVFVKGGGFIHSYGTITDPYFIYFLTFHIRLAQAYGKKVFVLPNSIGPLNNCLAKRMACKVLRKCELVSVRENISKTFLDTLEIKSELYPDLGFFLKPTDQDMSRYLKDKQIPLESKKVVITLRPYRFQGFINSEQLFSNYIISINSIIKHLNNKGYHVTFMAHTLGPSTHEDDRIAIKEVLDRLPKDKYSNVSYIEDFELTCRDIERIYSYYDYMIGTRFHSVIFSLNVGVPSIAIAYGGNKGKGIMSVLGNDDYSIDMDKINSNSLINIFDKLESNRVQYIENLMQKRIMINQNREDMIQCIREKLELQ